MKGSSSKGACDWAPESFAMRQFAEQALEWLVKRPPFRTAYGPGWEVEVSLLRL